LTAEVSSTAISPGKSRSLPRSRTRSARTPPSTFLFLPIHLSNSPEALPLPPSGEPEGRRSLSLRPLLGGPVPRIVRSFRGAPSRRERTARRMAVLYGSELGIVNHKPLISEKGCRPRIQHLSHFLPVGRVPNRLFRAALEPHSSVVLGALGVSGERRPSRTIGSVRSLGPLTGS
jgi:hypothetical protein